MSVADAPRDAAEAEKMRAAYVAGATARLSYTTMSHEPHVWLADDWRPASEAAAKLYPNPQRPRVVKDPSSYNGREWRFVEGEFETRVPHYRSNEAMREWHRVIFTDGCASYVEDSPAPILERVRMWADLLEHPTEEISP